MAFIKKEARGAVYVRKWEEQGHHPAPLFEKPRKPDFYGILDDLREECAGNALHLEMIDSLAEVYETEDRPWIGLVGNLTARHGKQETKAFLAHIRSAEGAVDC